uniref:Amine oxidase n=1 Tax=Alexandrium monilatum TaxID=311494 RepID=A0A7S4SWI7_9DINO
MRQLAAAAWLCAAAAAGAADPAEPIACTVVGGEADGLPACAAKEASVVQSDDDGEEVAMLARPRAFRARGARYGAPRNKSFSEETLADLGSVISNLPPIHETQVSGKWNGRPVPPGVAPGESSKLSRAPSSAFDVDPADFRKYRNGHHRRPTDPPTREEIVMVQKFLFGPGPVSSTAEADALFATEPWQTLRPGLAASGVGGIHPATISGIVDPGVACPPLDGPTYDEYVGLIGVDRAFAALLNCSRLRCHSRHLWHAREIGVEVPDRQHVLDVEAAIESGKEKYRMSRILSVRMTGGYHKKTYKGKDYTKWGSEVFIAVDVANPKALRVVPKYVDVYEKALDYKVKPPTTAPLDNSSAAILRTATSAMYLDYQTMGTTLGLPSNYLPQYNGRPGDFVGTPVTYIMKFARPFEHRYGSHAYTYGQGAKEWIMSAELGNIRYEAFPIDGHAVSSGTIIGQMPLTFIYAINSTGGYVNPEQTLPSFTGGHAESAAMTWYGRGMTFNHTGGSNLLAAAAAHMGIDVAGTPLAPLKKDRNAAMYAEVVEILAEAIWRAWGDDEAIPGTGFRPGALARARKHGRVVNIPADALKHSFDVPTFNNHATAPGFNSDGSPFLPPGRTRDARSNPPWMAPPLDANGEPQYSANGPSPPGAAANRQSHPTTAPYKIDGYAVTYDVGMKWKVLLSFDRSAGLTFWNLRMRLPPSAESPDGAEYSLLFRANVPNFGTDYATGSLGNPQAFTFLESHYGAATAHVKGASCKGATLPAFKHKGGGGPFLRNKFGVQTTSYATLGVRDFVDPFFHLPMEAFPVFETGMAEDALIQDAFCIEEHIPGVNNWHMYAMQTERCLTVSQTTISDAYNVIVKGEFCNTGHIFIGQDLQGKPAPSGPATIDGVGGAFSARGRGGYAANHLHWGVVALEGFVGGEDNVLQVVDAEQDGDTDIFGMAFNFLTKRVTSARDKEKLSFKHCLDRSYRLAGVNSSGEEIGGLKLESHCWGSHIKRSPQAAAAGIPLERQYYGNHWWLRDQDVFVLPVDQKARRRDTMDLLSNGRVGQHYDFYRSTEHAQAGTSDFGKSFAMFSVLKMRHNVQTEELPIQVAFKKHGVNLKPHMLTGFNMDILTRYDPAWNRNFQTNFIGTGGREYVEALSYTSEFATP